MRKLAREKDYWHGSRASRWAHLGRVGLPLPLHVLDLLSLAQAKALANHLLSLPSAGLVVRINLFVCALQRSTSGKILDGRKTKCV